MDTLNDTDELIVNVILLCLLGELGREEEEANMLLDEVMRPDLSEKGETSMREM